MKYCIAENTGQGFITHRDNFLFEFQGYPLNIWVLKDNTGDLDWIQRVNGVQKTKEEVQVLLDAETLRLQQEWDLANPDVTEEDEIYLERPTNIILP
jgi:hypothetical protein